MKHLSWWRPFHVYQKKKQKHFQIVFDAVEQHWVYENIFFLAEIKVEDFCYFVKSSHRPRSIATNGFGDLHWMANYQTVNFDEHLFRRRIALLADIVVWAEAMYTAQVMTAFWRLAYFQVSTNPHVFDDMLEVDLSKSKSYRATTWNSSGASKSFPLIGSYHEIFYRNIKMIHAKSICDLRSWSMASRIVTYCNCFPLFSAHLLQLLYDLL